MRVCPYLKKFDPFIPIRGLDWNYANWPKHEPVVAYHININPDFKTLSQNQKAWNRLVLDTCEDISWFWTDEWQAGERKASSDIKKGRFAKLKTVEELISHLNDLRKKR